MAGKAGMIKPGLKRPKADFDIAQTFPIGQLSECHAEKLVQAGEALHLVLAAVLRDQAAKFRQGEQIHELGENGATEIHRRPFSACSSEQIQIDLAGRTHKLLIFRRLRRSYEKHWDTSAHDYKRHGTTTLFAALSLLEGRVIGDF